MKNKRISAGIAALFTVCSLAACGSGETPETTTVTTTGVTVNTSELSDEEKDLLNKAADEKIGGELENKTVKWMANWDINPDSTGKSKSAELTMFEEKFGGVIKYYPTTFDNQYSDLSTAILSGEGIDFFPIGALDNYINGIVNGMFQPVDEYVDFNGELWSNVKNANDQLMINGKHYSLVHSVTAGEVVIYSKKAIEERGLDDPAELLENGEWNWDTYQNMLAKFVDNDSGLYGIDGWWIEQPIYLTTGKSLISLDNGVVSSNIKSHELERAMNYIYDLNKNSYLIDKSIFGWMTNEAFIGTGEELFFPCGLWTLWRDKSLWAETFGEDAMFVPIPKDPNTDKYYLPGSLEGYLMCKGAQNPEGVVKFLECTLTVARDEELNALNKQKIIDDYGWREDMADMMYKVNDMTRENPVFELYAGTSNDIKSLLDTAKTAASGGTEWNTTVETYSDTIDMLVDEINQKLAAQ